MLSVDRDALQVDMLIILNADDEHILVTVNDRPPSGNPLLALPRLTLPARQRGDVGLVNRWVAKHTGLLCITRAQLLAADTRANLLECLSPQAEAPSGMRWLARDGVQALSRREQALLQQLPADDAPDTLPWMRKGWFQQAEATLNDIAERMDMLPIAPVRQQLHSNRACVLSVETSAGVLTFKAVPEAFSYEPVITRVLSLRYPGRTPDVRAVNIEQGWMLMRGLQGELLQSQADILPWRDAMRHFAEMQIDLSRNTAALIALGLADRHVDQIASQIDHLLYDLPATLAPDVAEGLRGAGRHLRNLCFDLLDYQIPLSLVHGDLRPATISIEPLRGPLFFDWSDCAVSHPFFDLPSFMADAADELPRVANARMLLRDAYLQAWSAYEPMQRLNEAYALAEVIGPLHQAMLMQRLNLLPLNDPRLQQRLNLYLQRSHAAYLAYTRR